MIQPHDIFDRIAASAATPQAANELSKEELPALDHQGLEAKNASTKDARTPPSVRRALQHLLAHGWLESAAKPQWFRLIAAQTTLLDALLEPLDLRVVVDDVRGLAFLAVVPDYAGDDTDESEQDVYTKQWHGPSFCVHCGSGHEKRSIEGRATKKGVSWTFRCTVCEGWTLRTHCYQCAHTLFKNGTQWTYHETLADQVTNVLCPACGAYFDTSFRAL